MIRYPHLSKRWSLWQILSCLSTKDNIIIGIAGSCENYLPTHTSYVMVARFWLCPFGCFPFACRWDFDKKSSTCIVHCTLSYKDIIDQWTMWIAISHTYLKIGEHGRVLIDSIDRSKIVFLKGSPPINLVTYTSIAQSSTHVLAGTLY